MTITINRRVGRSGLFMSKHDDVRNVVQLLKGVDKLHGGAKGTLKEAPTCAELETAICVFQVHHFGTSTGFVDPDNVTLQFLNQYAAGEVPAPHAMASQIGATRQRIVHAARTMIGRVSNRLIDVPVAQGDGAAQVSRRRLGWRELWEIYTGAGIPTETEEEYRARIAAKPFRLPAGKKIPFNQFMFPKPGTPGPMGWCGVFATWAVNQAGMNIKLVPGHGLTRPDGSRIPWMPPAGVTTGDVCVVNDRAFIAQEKEGELGLTVSWPTLFHHIVVASPPNDEGIFDAVEGNQAHHEEGGHSIADSATRMPKARRHIRELMHRYDLFATVSL